MACASGFCGRNEEVGLMGLLLELRKIKEKAKLCE
jgi:hypothetical protein